MHCCGISCHIRSSLTAEASRSGYSSSTVPANCLLTPAGCQQPSRPVACSREGERSSPHGSGRPEGVWRRHRGRSAEKSSPNASSRWPKCASARASRAGAEGARRDTMPGGGGALATVHSGQSQAATGQHVGSALLQPGLTCTGRTEAVLSSGARHRIWANFDRRHSSPRARSDKMLTVWKSRLVHRKRLPCEPAAGWLVVDSRGDFFRLFL